jgi:3-hydroxyisobutyrate dehydrogenase-like beta-hydroxyacid dehydrogenase
MSSAVAILGFGEAAQTFVSDRRWQGQAFGYDIKTDAPATRAAKLADYARVQATPCESAAEAVREAETILSLVTADQAAIAALVAAPHLKSGALFLDMNSVAPSTKQGAARHVTGQGGRYVDVAIMAPVRPAALEAPVLVSGPDGLAALAALRALGFAQVRDVGREIGRASCIKMVRSVLIKSVEAAAAECLLAADAGAVTEDVLASLSPAWREQLNYNLERVLSHGLRRAAEMEEVALTLRDLGVEPLLTERAAARQRELGALHISPAPEALADKLACIRAVTKANRT